jgi:putative glutamine amidotransferase
MKIAISQRVVHDSTGDRDALEQSYTKYLTKFGITLIPVPNNLENIEKHLLTIKPEGIILSGGNDINPALYGGSITNTVYAHLRDNTEKNLLDVALSKNLPVLGICRGAQYINVYFGGQLEKIKEHVTPSHQIEIVDEQSKTYFLKNKTNVNSYHHFGIPQDKLAKELRRFAQIDGFIEGFFHLTKPVAGILWHPERESPDNELNEKLLEAYVRRQHFWKV